MASLTCTREARTGSVGARIAPISSDGPQANPNPKCSNRLTPAMVRIITGPARVNATRHRRSPRGRRNFNPQTNSEKSTATSDRCSIQKAASLISSLSKPRPEGPMATPSTRQTAEVVTGNQRR
ncbi:hypothetical protein D3C76_998380 [compost metagenome]